jgi:hypothetical protein
MCMRHTLRLAPSGSACHSVTSQVFSVPGCQLQSNNLHQYIYLHWRLDTVMLQSSSNLDYAQLHASATFLVQLHAAVTCDQQAAAAEQ